MERYEQPGTDKTPHLVMDHGQGLLTITGRSFPENADRFFTPLLDEVDRYAAQPLTRTLIRVELSHFNSSSSKYLLDLFKAMEEVHASGRSAVQLEWRHAQNDLDMQEAGQDYRSLVEFPVMLVVF